MILKRISILNYKNLEQVEIGFSAKLNCFFGQNGMGKTNLLDAVYLSFCKARAIRLIRRTFGTSRISLSFKAFMKRKMVHRRRFIADEAPFQKTI